MIQPTALFKRTGLIVAGMLAVLLSAGEIWAFPYAPSTLTFTAVEGAASPPTQTVTFSKKSFVPNNWTANAASSWLMISPTSGTISTEKDTISVQVNPSGLLAGTYSSSFDIAVSNKNGGVQTATIPVTFVVSTSGTATTSSALTTTTPSISLNPTSLSFAGTAGGTNPAAQAIAISNVGGGTLTWNASSNASWLALSPLSGTNTGSVTATVNLAGLLAGTYTATVTVSATGATTKTLPVTLTLAASTTSGTINLNPTSLAFTGTAGGTDPATQPFAITNSGGGTLSWALSSNAAWLHLSTSSGTTTTEIDTVTTAVTTSGLAAGTYNAVITITASGSTNSPRQIPVSLTLGATATSSVSLAWSPNSDTDLAGYKVYQGTSSGAYGAPVATVPKTTTSVAVTGLQTGTTYFFVIRAYNTAGNESLPSSEVSTSIY